MIPKQQQKSTTPTPKKNTLSFFLFRTQSSLYSKDHWQKTWVCFGLQLTLMSLYLSICFVQLRVQEVLICTFFTWYFMYYCLIYTKNIKVVTHLPAGHLKICEETSLTASVTGMAGLSPLQIISAGSRWGRKPCQVSFLGSIQLYCQPSFPL